MFADDTDFSISGSPKLISQLLSRVVNCIESVLRWMETNHLQLNLDTDKTKMVISGKPHVVKAIGPLEIKVRDMKITTCDYCECLEENKKVNFLMAISHGAPPALPRDVPLPSLLLCLALIA